MRLIKKIENHQYEIEYICFPEIDPQDIFDNIGNFEYFLELDCFYGFIIRDKMKNSVIMITDAVNTWHIYYNIKKNKAEFFPDMQFSGNEIDSAALKCFLKYRYIISPLFFFKTTKTCIPWSVTVLKNGKTEIIQRKYFDYNKTDIEHKEFEELIEYKFSELAEKMKLKNAGLFLSGGMDSTGVAIILKNIIPDLKAISTVFPGYSFDEKEFSQGITQKLDIKHKKIKMNCSDYISFWEKMPYIYPQPVSTHTAPCFNKMIKKFEGNTIFSGFGGDEIFGGDIKYIHSIIMHEFAEYAIKHSDTSHINGFHCFNSFIEFYKNDFQGGISDNGDDILSSMIDFNIKHWQSDYENFVLNNIFNFYGKNHIAPFLTPSFLSKVNSLKNKYKINGSISRYIYRKWIEKKTNTDFAFRQSQGFSVPLNKMLRDELKDFSEQKIFSFTERKDFRRFFNKNEIYDNIKSINEGENRYNSLLIIIILEIFLAEYEKNKGPLYIS